MSSFVDMRPFADMDDVIVEAGFGEIKGIPCCGDIARKVGSTGGIVGDCSTRISQSDPQRKFNS
jgi:hypothetical protein